MASLTAREVVDIMSGDVGDLDSEDSEIDEHPSFPLPRASSSEDSDSDTGTYYNCNCKKKKHWYLHKQLWVMMSQMKELGELEDRGGVGEEEMEGGQLEGEPLGEQA